MPCSASRLQMLRSRKSEKEINNLKFRRSSTSSSSSLDKWDLDDVSDSLLSEYFTGFYTRTFLSCGAIVFAIAAIYELFYVGTLSLSVSGDGNAWRKANSSLNDEFWTSSCQIEKTDNLKAADYNDFSEQPLIFENGRIHIGSEIDFQPSSLRKKFGETIGEDQFGNKLSLTLFLDKLLTSDQEMYLKIDLKNFESFSSELKKLFPGINKENMYCHIWSSGSSSDWRFNRYPSLHLIVHGKQRMFVTGSDKVRGGVVNWYRDTYKTKGPEEVIGCMISEGQLLFVPENKNVAFVNVGDSISLTFFVHNAATTSSE